MAIKYLKRVGLEDKKDEYPNKLSGGQRRDMLRLLEVSASDPEIMLFDEPTSALDPGNGRGSS